MRQTLIFLALALLPLYFLGQSTDKNQVSFIAFTNVTVLDMTGGPARKEMTVLVTGNRITPAGIKLLKAQYQKELQLVGVMTEAGIPLLAGSDDLNPHVFPGFGLHDELGLMAEAGLSPLQALQAATLNLAKYLGLTDSLGTVEKGKWADLLLLDADPLENISNSKKIAGVVANGRYYSKEALQQMLKEAETMAGKK
jgi:imidazolonepropionase-like amidohydrolase